LMGILHLAIFLVGCLGLAALALRQRGTFLKRVGRFGFFMGLLLVIGSLLNGLWSCVIWGRLYFSTDYVFAGDGNAPFREDDVCQPLNVYGESKLAGERYLRELSRNFLLIRTAWLYGPRGKNFVKTILEKAASVRTLKVVDDQIGSPTCTYDLAEAVKRLVEDGAKGIFHITNGGSCSWYEFARAILEEAGVKGVEVLPVKSDEFPRPAKRPCFGVLDGSKFYKTTGITIRPWRMALRDCLPKIVGGKDKI
ncbi:MAG: sugar nucleotide-binding protein, partial [Deltaproteobacteria bacterium]|nr:sugar nucleotide-binding protein [Deltaproteobacteria bacterium]